jgi:hypothetical protein
MIAVSSEIPIGRNPSFDFDFLQFTVQACLVSHYCLFHRTISRLYSTSKQLVVGENKRQVQRSYSLAFLDQELGGIYHIC